MSNDPRRRFARFYFDDFIRDYPEIYKDDAALSGWLRLLVAAEKAWPALPELPRSVTNATLRKLAPLVAVGPDYTYEIRGWRVERERRHAGGLAGAHAKHAANASANGHANAVQEREREENEKNSPLPLKRGRRANGTNPRATGENPRALGTSPRQEREAEKRAPVPMRVHDILSGIQTRGKEA